MLLSSQSSLEPVVCDVIASLRSARQFAQSTEPVVLQPITMVPIFILGVEIGKKEMAGKMLTSASVGSSAVEKT
jgi:hypothetical protein